MVAPAPATGTSGAAYAHRRRLLLNRSDSGIGAGAVRRGELTALTDHWLAQLLAAVTDDPRGLALVAVGGYGRGQLSPGSDLDLVLLHDGRRDAAEVASRIWYPIWDCGVRLDHSLRTPEEARRLAAEDLAVLLGLLDLRLVGGDARLAGALRSAVLADWRAGAVRRLPQLHEACRQRWERHGEAAFALEPDLKSARGGLRDVVALRAVAASWVADRPHGGLDAAAGVLLDVRDELHRSTGRASDRLVLQEQDAVAARLGRTDPDDLLREVNAAARTVAYAGDVTWRRVEQIVRQARSGPRRLRRPGQAPGPVLRPLATGLLCYEGELVLGPDAHPATDPVLLLRAAALAAREGLALGPATVERLAAEAPRLPEPWPPAARDAFLDLLGAGPAALPVWEALDQGGLVVRLLPEWALIRSRPQRNAVHRYTVDRHLIETAIQAARRARQVARPDLLLTAALLHDIGKGSERPGLDHSLAGAALAGDICTRMGFPPVDVETVRTLVGEHLLLVDTATRRDLEDPATVTAIAQVVDTVSTLELLHALTESDALATGTGVWSGWRCGLVGELSRRTAAHLRGEPAPSPRPLTADQRRLADGVRAGRRGALDVALAPAGSSGWTVTVAAPDRQGLLAEVAGVLALHRLSVRSASLRTCDGVAVDVWSVVPEYGDPPSLDALREDVRRSLAGSLDVAALLARRESARAGGAGTPARRRTPVAPPQARVLPDASDAATVIEVRAQDRLGLLHRLGAALADSGVDVRSARVNTRGGEAVDVFYLVDGAGGPLGPERAAALADRLAAAAGG